MPLYGYKCTPCTHDFEVLVSFNDKEQPACPQCGSRDTRREQVPKSASFVLKGTGWTKKIGKKYHT